ncbi:transcriptional regulator [Pseudomonas sp. 21LCFQ02]|uniref:helix-turn-helix domain-containing protein n=1 Tax=unclassified Pseudomonas TaxID=196821 RepID=UPI0004F7858E|nr:MULTISPECIES: transcriptional regulator [unclassified Pseudomonas]MCO8160868.1 transcriptional regulator [Pseudomonas sp. 21LCFQ010]MCO8168026.1 transcriptional regulator [Pseudomonas sp. 21LCFQ02]MCQ9423274.1 transcriptional regulator [Pseudomonas sp. LJDD11]BAP44630.1 DNA-binding protein [Pseudomonas sp. StFLB209]
MDTFATRLKQERKTLGLTQQQFASLGGVEVNAQAMYESGVRVPRSAYLVELWQNGVDVLYLISGRRTALDLDRLSATEREVITSFRAMAPEDRESISALTASLSERMRKQ